MQKRKGKKFTKLLIRLPLFVFAISIVVSLVSRQVDIINKKQQLSEVSQQVKQLEQKNRELQGILDMEEDEAYYERMAREKLGLIYPDERVYIDMSGK